MPKKIPLTNLERLLGRIKSPLTRLYREMNRALIVPNWPKCQFLQHKNFTENNHR